MKHQDVTTVEGLLSGQPTVGQVEEAVQLVLGMATRLDGPMSGGDCVRGDAAREAALALRRATVELDEWLIEKQMDPDDENVIFEVNRCRRLVQLAIPETIRTFTVLYTWQEAAR